jgi:FtsP/CotA-like multicopper oxidase with cupredoxin domain
MKTQDGELWRLTNASAQVTYQLELEDDSTTLPIPMQLVAIDGVSISIPPGTPAGTVMAMGGNKFVAVDCPPGDGSTLYVCVSDLVMMPSSRAEVWVTYRRPDGTVAKPPANAAATLKQVSPRLSAPLGREAEHWPQLKLAHIEFAEPKPTKSGMEVAGGKMVSASAPLTAFVAGLAGRGAQPTAQPMTNATPSPNQPPPGACEPLPHGHHRRIFFGLVNPTDANSLFGLGYEEVDNETGAVVPGTQVPIAAFDPAQTMICLPVGPGGTVVHEIWELINLATETHNFHIHQTKFTVLSVTDINHLPQQPGATGILEDNVPVRFSIPNIAAVNDLQNGYCTIEQWRAGQCTATPIVLDIPFSQIGDFVFHCHILEHEDSGMMAKIRVMARRE